MTPRDPCQAAGGCDRLPDLPAARLWVLERGGREAGPWRPWAPFGDLASLFSAFYFHRRGCKAGGRGVGRTRESTSSKSWLEDRWVSWAPNTGQAAPTEPLTSRVGLSFLTSDVAPGYRPQEVWHVGADASCPQLPPWAAGPPHTQQAPAARARAELQEGTGGRRKSCESNWQPPRWSFISLP